MKRVTKPLYEFLGRMLVAWAIKEVFWYLFVSEDILGVAAERTKETQGGREKAEKDFVVGFKSSVK